MTTELRSTPIGAISISTTSCSLQREIVGRHDTRACQQHGSVGKRLRPAEISGELLETALDIAEASFSGEYRCASSRDRAADRPLSRVGFCHAEPDPRTQRARAIVDLGLRQIQQVLAFDVARAHVVADRAADDAPARVDHERKLRLRHTPFCVAPNAHALLRSRRPFQQAP